MLNTQIEGGIIGALVGDALGVPYEFHRPSEIPKEINMVPPEGFSRSHPGVPPGTWSDDGAQVLALLDSLLSRRRLEEKHLGERLCAWLFEAKYTPDGRVFDCGLQTRRALELIYAGSFELFNRPFDDKASQGNGSLMRCISLPLWHKGSDQDLVNDAILQSAVTHWNMRAHICCAIYCLWARGITEGFGVPEAWTRAFNIIWSQFEQNGPALRALNNLVRWDSSIAGTGEVVDSLLSAAHAVMTSCSYEQTVRVAISLGNDTDTTACIAGGIAGIIYGVKGIPKKWRDALRGRDVYRPLVEDLISWRAPSV